MTQYSDIAKTYDSITNLKFRKYCETWMFQKLIGDITGYHVLDVACGAGFVTGVVSEFSPSYICAIDIESKMIELAKSKKYAIDNIDFICSDINELNHFNRYDLVVGAFSLNEIKNTSELEDYISLIFKFMRNDGTAIFEFDNAIEASEYDWSEMGYPTYDIVSSEEGNVRYRIGINSPEGFFELECSYYSATDVQQAFHKAGFKSIDIHDVEISKEGIQQMGKEYWANLSKVPLTRFIKARKYL